MISDAWLDRSSSPSPLLRGLAKNPAAPIDVLLRLLERRPEQVCEGLRRRRELPPPVRDAMLHHPSPRIRGALAAHPQVDPRARAKLLADPAWRVRMRAFGRPGQRPVSDDVLVQLLAELDGPPSDMPFSREELIGELFEAMRHDRHLFRLAAAHPRPGIRRYAARSLSWLDEPSRQALLEDEAPEVRAAAAESVADRQQVMEPADLPDQHCTTFWYVLQRPLSRALIDQVLASGDVAALRVMGENPTIPPDVVDTLLRHPDPSVRRGVTGRADLTGDQLVRLAADPAVEVRTAVSTHPGLTEHQRAGIDIDVTTVPGDGHFGSLDVRCRWIPYPDDPTPELADALRWARSVNPLLRRRAARNAELPAEIVTILADDPDLGVRVLLAQHHPAAPPALLLRCFLEYHCCGRDRLSELPQFPTEGLARFADDPDPAVRRLVALGPRANPELVDRLSTDPDATVRQAMACCPRLPVPRIIALLDDPELTEAASANPALPVDQMQQILDESTAG
jgi:HEAT repeat protein